MKLKSFGTERETIEKIKRQPWRWEKEMATHSSITIWESHRQKGLAGYDQWGQQDLDMTEH